MVNRFGSSYKTTADVNKIFAKCGTGEFTWEAIRGLDLNAKSPTLYNMTKVFTRVRKNGNINVYRLSHDYLPFNECQTRYRVKKSRMNVCDGSVDAGILAATVSISAVTILIGYLLISNMEIASLPSISHSVLSTSSDVVLGGFGNASGVLAFGLFCLVGVFIIGIIGHIAGRGE